MTELGRRDFLKLMGLTGAATAVGCSSESARTLIPYISPPEDVIPGKAIWYATTCRECPAGCGLLAKNRDGHVIKVEGNPLHPISGGKLCPRGQASLHGLYNPDRFSGPLKKEPGGKFTSITWEEGETILARSLEDAFRKGRGDRIVFLTDQVTGSLEDLIGVWLREMGSPGGHIVYEAFSYEPLREANKIVFGLDTIPHYRVDQADFLISFNAGFLETWLSNVEYARQFSSFHALRGKGKHPFIFVGPRLSMTANNAEIWIPVVPGDEYLIALAILRVILDENLIPTINLEQQGVLTALVAAWPMERITGKTGIQAQLIRDIAHRFVDAERPLALAEGLSLSCPNATATAISANLLCSLKPGSQQTIDFSGASAYGGVARAYAIKELSERMKRGDVEVLLILGANPLFSLPASWEFRKCLEAIPTIVTFSSAVDETNALAHLILPSHTPLESWGDYSPRKGIFGLMQPVMGSKFNSRPVGDVLLSTGRSLKGQERFAWQDFYAFLQDSWTRKWQEAKPAMPFESFWEQSLKRGGYWETNSTGSSGLSLRLSRFRFPEPDVPTAPEIGFHFTAYPTIQFFDGRGANRLWLQELPDPMTQTTWGGWVEIHPQTAENYKIEKGDMLRIKSPYGTIDIPALPIPTVPENLLAVPIGQGHTSFGQFADGHPANPMQLFTLNIDSTVGATEYSGLKVSIEKLGGNLPIAHTDGSFFQHGRDLAQVVAFSNYREAAAAEQKPEIDPPLPEGFDPKRDFYPPHEHKDYRWCMVVDLDRCIGCGACVIACYAENNLAVVGREQVLKSREMSWLRVQRYFEPDAPIARWLPMLCQHCDCAPCESVCPVYAPHHSKEGLNNQVYNRCIGTRFCHQNDPYKVRRFNFFTYTRPEPLNWQFNPDVLVRQKGVMEKCSFCIQRIIEAKTNARNEGRKVRDGEFTTACAQTCPADVFTFGSLLDPESRVSKMIWNPRAYQVLGHLNTKPAVIYLKKVTETLDVIA
jgi:anaerobic selenocysteine-containing dehydrogenase/Fe-S-cluster-containing dehydrogenase component